MTRTRMIPVKANHKGSHSNQECRWCSKTDVQETQEHVISKCQAINTQNEEKINYPEIFQDENTTRLKKTADILKTIYTKITESNQD